MEDSQIVAQGDHVVVNWIAIGTHDGPLTTRTGETVPATGRKSTMPGSSTMGFKDGKIVWKHDYYDVMTLLANIGAGPGA